MVVFNNALAGAAGQSAGGAAAGSDYSLRFNSGDSAYLNRTPSSAGNRKTWTWSGWVKRSSVATTDQGIFSGSTNATFLRFKTNQLDFVVNGFTHRRTNAVFRDNSAWYHFVWAVDTTQATASDRSRFYVNGVEVTSWSIDNAITQNDDTGVNNAAAHIIGATDTIPNDRLDAYIADFYLIDGQQLSPTDFGAFDATTGAWNPIAYSGSYGTNGFHLDFSDNSSASALGTDAAGSNDWTVNNISVAQGTGNYVSGITVGNFTLTDYDKNDVVDGDLSTFYGDRPINGNGLNFSSIPQASTSVRINYSCESGTFSTNAGTLTTGAVSQAWRTISTTYPFTLTSLSVSGGSSAQGFFVYAIEVDGTVLVDNTFASNNDSLFDSPTNGTQTDTGAGGEVSGGYATFNPLNTSTYTFANGNLDSTGYAPTNQMTSTIGVSSGKWYAEFVVSGSGGISNTMIGISRGEEAYYPGQLSTSYGYIAGTGQLYNNGSASSYASTYTYGDVIGVALDMDAGTLTYYKNGSSLGQAASGLSGTYFFACRGSSGVGDVVTANFGQRPFAYQNVGVNRPSADFKALCTANLPTPDIEDGSTAFDVVTWTGDSNTNSTRSFSSLSFSPEFVWMKDRSQANQHTLYDIVRGPSNGTTSKALMSNSAGAEGSLNDDSTYGYLSSFDTNGFSVWRGTDGAYTNRTGNGYVAWTWDGGSSTVSNTDGSISSQVRANTDAGFSIVTWSSTTGTAHTFGHGLGVAPKFLIVKRRSATGSWMIGHDSLGWTTKLAFDTSAQAGADGGYWSNTAPTSTVVSIGDASNIGGDNVAYCWAPVEGYSAFGSYTGNGLPDGPFVYTGHRSRWIMVKRTDFAIDWIVIDTARSDYNQAKAELYPNAAAAEGTNGGPVDINSNGFKVRTNSSSWNASGGTYIFASFAESPFKTARAR